MAVDHRGKRVRLHASGVHRVFAHGSARSPEGRGGRARAVVLRSRDNVVVFCAMWLMAFLALSIVTRPFLVGAAGWARVLTLVGAGVVSLGGVYLVHVFVARRAMARAVIAGALADGVCPGCRYPLEGLAPEADGCVVCPECGAAWRARETGVGDRESGER